MDKENEKNASAERKRKLLSINSQIDKIQDVNFRNYTQNVDRRISSLAERQSRMLSQLYDTIEKEERDRLKKSFADRQDALRQSLEDWKSYQKQINADLTLADKFASNVFYWNRRRDLRDLEREARYRFDDIADEAEELSESMSDSFGSVADSLRDWATALNVNQLASGMEDTTMSLREIRVELKKYMELSDEQWSALRDQASEFSKETDYAISNLEYLENMTAIVKFGYDDQELAALLAKVTSKFEAMTGVAADAMGNVFEVSMLEGMGGEDYVRTITSQMMKIQQTNGLYTNAEDLMSAYDENLATLRNMAGGNNELLNTYLEQAMALRTATNASYLDGLDEKLYELMATPMSEMSDGMLAIGGAQIQKLMQSGDFKSAAEMYANNLNSYLNRLSNPSARLEFLNQMGFDDPELQGKIMEGQNLEDFLSSYDQAMGIIDEQANAASKFVDEWKPSATSLEKLGNQFKASDLGSWLDDVSSELDITLAEAMLIGSGAINIGKSLAGGVKGLGKLFGWGKAASTTAEGAAEATAAAKSGKLAGVVSKAAPYAAGAAPGLALTGYGIYGATQAVDAGQSTVSEWQEGDYGRSVAYGADTAAIAAGAGGTIAAGGIATAAGISAAAGGATAGAAAMAGLSAIPVVGWVAAGLLAVGLATKAILDNTEKVNGFAEALDRTRDNYKDQVSKEIRVRKDELYAIRESIDLYGEEYNYRKALLELGYSEGTLEGIDTAEKAEDFTQQVTNALNDVESYANDKIDADINNAIADLSVADDKRSGFISTAVSTLLGSDKEAEENSAEWKKVKNFLDTLAEGMEGQAKEDFVSMYTGALSSHGGISDEELRGILGDKSFGAGWRAFWSTDVDLKKAFMDNASDLTAYNKAIEYYLGGDESLLIDDGAIKALQADEAQLALLTGYYKAWQDAQNDNVKSALADLYQAEMEVLKNSKYYDKYHKDEYAYYANQMGIPGYESATSFDNGNTHTSSSGRVHGGGGGHFAIGLDRVPYDNFAAYLHKDEAVLTAEEAEIWRQSTAGWTPNDKSKALSLGTTVVNQVVNLDDDSDDDDDATLSEVVETLKWLGKEIKKAIEDASDDSNNGLSNNVLNFLTKTRNTTEAENLFRFMRI